MIQAYKKILEMRSNEKSHQKIENILYQDFSFLVDKLIAYLKKELDITYYYEDVTDINGNIAKILVKKDSMIYKENLLGKKIVPFNIEEIIDKRMFENKNEIIILDINSEENLLDLEYMCESLEYNYLSYSEEIKSTLSNFVNYVLNKALINAKI